MPTSSYSQSQRASSAAAGVWTKLAAKIFSFPAMCMSLLALVIFSYAPQGISIGEGDIWWHLLDAQYCVQHHSFPQVDTYSLTGAGSHWIDYEWISEILFYKAFTTARWQGILVLYSLVMVLIFAGVYYRSCRAGADCKDAAVATLGGICFGAVSLAPRMLLFGWLCLTGLLLVLDRFRRTGKGIWLLPPLFLVWVNLHGSWIYGFIVLFLTIGSGLIQGKWGMVVAERWSATDLRKLLLTLAASLAAIFVNPFGYKLVLIPFDFVFRSQVITQTVQYWLSVDFSTWNGKLAMGLIFCLLAAALFSRRPWRLDEILLVAFALWSGLSHVRLLDFAAIIIVPIVAPHLKLFPPYEPNRDKPGLNAVLIAAVVAAIIFSFPTESTLQRQIDDQYPRAALEFMQHHNMNGRIFNSAEFGGYMEWTRPQMKPFVDIYNGAFDDYAKLLLMRQPLDVLDKYSIDYVLLRRGWPLAYLLRHSTVWRLIYSDQITDLFERVPPTAATAPPNLQSN